MVGERRKADRCIGGRRGAACADCTKAIEAGLAIPEDRPACPSFRPGLAEPCEECTRHRGVRGGNDP
jgi:hypothetical protein